MPTLFISYKRGTAGIIPLMERLRAEHYRLWYDKDDIHTGENWRESINKGVDTCDALVVGLTPGACRSEFVQYEVQRGLKQGKLIFPVKMEAIDESNEPQLLGLTDIQYIDFTASSPTTWDTAFQKLLSDMQRHDELQITNHVIRKERGTDTHTLHQRYLKKLVSRIGTLSLANISPNASGTVQLKDVYIDSSTDLSISLKVKDWHIIDWWITDIADSNFLRKSDFKQLLDSSLLEMQDQTIHEIEISQADRFIRKAQPEALGFNPASFEALIGDIDDEIQQYRAAHPELKSDEKSSSKNKWNNGTKENYITLEIQDIASASDRLVVLGQPGSGKSTFVKHLALCLAGQQLEDWTHDAHLSDLRHWLHGDMTPIYIELRRFVISTYFPDNIQTQPSETDLWQYIEHEVLGSDLVGYLAELKYDVENGHALIIFDGLDEVPYPEGHLAQRQQQLISLADIVNTPRFSKSRILVTSRPYAYAGWQLPQFKAITITDFTDHHRRQLATKLYKASGLSSDQAQKKSEALNQQLSSIDPELKDRPLFLTLMATVYLRGEAEGLPTRRGALYRESILLLLDRWTSSKDAYTPPLTDILGTSSIHDLYLRLAALAFDVHEQYGDKQGTPEIDIGLLYKHLMLLGYGVGGQLIPYLSENAGVLVSPGQDEEKNVFHFAHRTFQEYLAAEHIVTICIDADSYKPVYDLITTKPQTWLIPCAFIGDVLADTGRKRELWALLADLLDDEPPHEQDHPAWWAIWLASEIVLEQKLHLQEKLNRHMEKPIRDGLVEWLVALITHEALVPIERAACGRTLALLGDTRKGVDVRKTGRLPDIAWGKEIPAVTYTIGGDEKAYRPLPEQKITFSYSYKLAKYPVTMAQFSAFVEADDGILLDIWWEELARQDKEEFEQTNKYGNHPRTDVTWYQAVAFCRWLTVKCHEAGILEADQTIRLPTEQELEVAARYPDGREFAYQGDDNSYKMNVRETGINQTSAVGLFSSGCNPNLGLYDMNGTVWEWCLNEYSKPEKTGLGGTARRVLRGGSWLNVSTLARSASRLYDFPYNRTDVSGFRVCLAPIHALNSEGCIVP